jgi:hypothetical protein
MSTEKWLNYLSIIFLTAVLSAGAIQCRDAGPQAANSKTGGDSQTSPLSDSGPGKTCSREPSVSAAQELGLKRVLILLNTDDQPSFEAVASKVQELGGKLTVSMAPKSLFALIPPEQESVISGLPEVKLISSGPVGAEKARGLAGTQKKLLDGWNRSLTGTRERTLLASPKPLIHDAKTRPPFNPAEIKGHAPREIPSDSGAGPATAAPEQEPQVAYEPVTNMSNTVTVAVFFPESNGVIDPDKENWTQNQIDTAMAEIAAAYDWWASKAPTDQKLSFTIYKSYTPFNSTCVKTSYEPITNPAMDEGRWIQQIMHCLGYGPATLDSDSTVYFKDVDSFNTWVKGTTHAKQAFSIFVVNDTTVNNHMFTDGYFAYAYLGGPFLVMTYDNDGYGIDNMDAVAAHESGHIFNAYDEYAESNCSCSEATLSCQNQNCDNNCSQNVCCIMRGQVEPYTNNCICDCTKGMIGWSCGRCGSQVCNFVVTTPASGQDLIASQAFNITWTTSGQDCASNVSLYFTANGGQSVTQIAYMIPNTGSYSWTAPTQVTNHGQIAVTDGGAFAVSGDFRITLCGNGVCDGSESNAICPADCPSSGGGGGGGGGGSDQETSSGHPGGMCGIWMVEGERPNGKEVAANLIIMLGLPLAVLVYKKKKNRKA